MGTGRRAWGRPEVREAFEWPNQVAGIGEAVGSLTSATVRPISLLRLSPTKIARLKPSGKSPMGLRILPLRIKLLLASNPLKSRILSIRRLAVQVAGRSIRRWRRATPNGLDPAGTAQEGSGRGACPRSEIREMGGAPRNPAPRNHFLVWTVKSSGCHCADAFGGK